MLDLLISLLINSIAIFAIGSVLTGVRINSYGTAVWVAVLLALVNAIVRPVVAFLSIPLIVITFGLFIFVVNTLMLMLVDYIVDGLEIENFWWALLFSLLLSLVNMLIF